MTAINEYDFYTSKITELRKNGNWKIIDYNDIKIDDIIIIYYYPFSQKYIYDLYPKYGRIIKIENKINEINELEKLTIENIYLSNEYNNNFNASHEWCGYYGNTRSYDFIIYKLFIDNQ